MKLLAGLLIAYVLLPPFELEAQERGRIKWKSPFPFQTLWRPRKLSGALIRTTEPVQAGCTPKGHGRDGSLQPVLNPVGLDRMETCEDVSVGIPAGQSKHIAGL
jgi:hypothetical protein